jgi:hypothetical protein
MEGSLTNLFDSFKESPLIGRDFELTQKLNDNFKDILGNFTINNEDKY